jgi:hypothetical protein
LDPLGSCLKGEAFDVENQENLTPLGVISTG